MSNGTQKSINNNLNIFHHIVIIKQYLKRVIDDNKHHIQSSRI